MASACSTGRLADGHITAAPATRPASQPGGHTTSGLRLRRRSHPAATRGGRATRCAPGAAALVTRVRRLELRVAAGCRRRTKRAVCLPASAEPAHAAFAGARRNTAAAGAHRPAPPSAGQSTRRPPPPRQVTPGRFPEARGSGGCPRDTSTRLPMQGAARSGGKASSKARSCSIDECYLQTPLQARRALRQSIFLPTISGQVTAALDRQG